RLERTRAAVQEAMQADDIDGFKGVVRAMAESGDVTMIAAAAMKLIFRAQGGERIEQDIPAMPVRPPDVHRPMQRYSPSPHERHRVAPDRPGERQPIGSAVRGREAGMVRVYVGAGREAGIRPGDLVGAIANEANVN